MRLYFLRQDLVRNIFLGSVLSLILAATSNASDEKGSEGIKLNRSVADALTDAVSNGINGLIGKAENLELTSTCGPETSDKDFQGINFCNEILKEAEELYRARSGFSPDGSLSDEHGVPLLTQKDREALNTATIKYKNSVVSCHNRQVFAAKICLSEENQGLQDTINVLTGVGGLQQFVASTNAACNKTKSTLDIVHKAMNVYQTTCTAARSSCMLPCVSAVSGLKTLLAIASGAQVGHEYVTAVKNAKIKFPANAALIAQQDQANRQIFARRLSSLNAVLAKDSEPKTNGSTAFRHSKCDRKYGQLLGSAALGIVGIVKAAEAAKKCEEQTAGAAGLPLDQKCKLDAHKNTQECLCFFSPRTPGCNNSLAKSGSTASAVSLNSGEEDSLQGRGPSSAARPTFNSDNLNPIGDSPSGGPSAKAAGVAGAGGSGFSGSGGGLDGGAYGDPGSPTEYNSGFTGGDGGFGGGGGGSWGGWSSSQNEGEGGLSSFVPGGTNDPNSAHAVTGGDLPSPEVTSQGGKSNWEKVRERYSNAKGSLIGP